jgi:hypothetical protein
MFLAPLSVPSSASSSRSPRRSRRRWHINAIVGAWLLAGCVLVRLVPSLRGGRLLGGTMPFWLVVAPLVDLAWLGRRDLARVSRAIARRTCAARRRVGALRLKDERVSSGRIHRWIVAQR